MTSSRVRPPENDVCSPADQGKMSTKKPSTQWRQLNRSLWRRITTAGIEPSLSGEHIFCAGSQDSDQTVTASFPQSSRIIFVQPLQSLADALIVELIRGTQQSSWPNSPIEPLGITDWQMPSSLLSLAKGVAGRITMRGIPTALSTLLKAPKSARQEIILVPVCVSGVAPYLPRTVSSER